MTTTKPKTVTTRANVKTHAEMATTATDAATVAARATALQQDATADLRAEQLHLEDLHQQRQGLDAQIAHDSEAIATARTRLAALPEGMERARLSQTVAAGTTLEAAATKKLVELAAGHQFLLDQIAEWERTTQDREQTEAAQHARIAAALTASEERISALQLQISRARDAARQAHEQQGVSALQTFRDELAALDEGIADASTRLARRRHARAHLTSSIASRLAAWPALMQQAQRSATPAAADPLPYRLLVAFDAYLAEIEAIQAAGGIPNGTLVYANGALTEWSIATALTQTDVFVLGVLADYNCGGEGRLGARSLGERRSRVRSLLARERPRPPSPALPPLPLPLLPDDEG